MTDETILQQYMKTSCGWFQMHCNVALCVMAITLRYCWGSVTKKFWGML